MKKNFIILCTLAAGVGSLCASPQETEMKPTAISIFKNGYGFVTLQGKLGSESSIRLNSLPVPSAGTFWIQAEQGAEITSMVSGLFDYERSVPYDMMDLAAANPGAEVTVLTRINAEDTRRINGTVLPFPRETTTRQGNTIDAIEEEGKNPLIGNILLIQTSTGTSAIERSTLISLDFRSPISIPKRVDKRPCVELQLAQASPDKLVQASCLSAGITWLPSYRLDLQKDNKAILSAKATITNSLMDFDNVSMELITGFPSLENPDKIDPMAMNSMMTAARSHATTLSNRTSSNTIKLTSGVRTDVCAADECFDVASGPVAYAGRAASGTDTGNLFFYPVANFSAKVGQVVGKTLFSEEIDYKRVYTWRVGDPTQFHPVETGQAPELSDINDCVRFTNPLDMPLTAASIEFILDKRIAGTNNLYYTPAKQECTVQMGKAINITTIKDCKILKQESIDYPSLNQKSGIRKATKNTCEVTLTLNNTGDEEAYMEVSQRVQGQVIEMNEGGECQSLVRANTAYLSLQNIIRWKITIPAQQSKQLKFTYDRVE